MNSENQYVETYKIKDIGELFNKIKGNDIIPDLRKNFIFRGVSDVNYELIPSVLRKNDLGYNTSSDFIDDSDFKFFRLIHTEELYEDGEISKEVYDNNKKGFVIRYVDKNLNERPKDSISRQVSSKGKFAQNREINILLNFFDFADKSGLKVPFNQRIRELIHKKFDDESEMIYSNWPNSDYFEIMSLAQHYGLPTRALDWSYDYNVALYFAVKDIVSKEPKNCDCALWALNYVKFEKNYQKFNMSRKNFPLHFYRPEYNTNPNLNAQKGLFTIWADPIDEYNSNSLDKRLSLLLNENKDGDTYRLPHLIPFIIEENESIFYKFIISKNLKKDILNELYLEGYSEEFLFPGYGGITVSMKNKVKLSELLNK